MKKPTRRYLTLASATAALMLGVSACGGSSGGEEGGDVELRFSWWGSTERAEITQQAIDLFEEQNPGITVQPEYTDFDAYFDRLATTVAGGDAPDVITLGGAYPREYGDRGALLDLDEVSDTLDLSPFPDSALGSGEFSGTQYGVPTGVNTYAILANPRVFEEAGVEMPDDETWSWEDYVELAEAIGENSEEGVYGTADPTAADTLDLHSRQLGESLYTEEGELNISTDTLESWWEMTASLSESGAAPEASITTELAGQAAPEQSLMGRGLAGLQFAWSNQYAAYQTAAGEPLELLRAPGESQQNPGMWLQASQIYSISARSDHPVEAAKLVDFLVNDPGAAEIVKTDRGVPANPDVLEAIQPELSETQQVETQFVGRMSEVAGDPLVVGPLGSTETPLTLDRLNSEVLFNRLSPSEAANQFVEQVNAAITR